MESPSPQSPQSRQSPQPAAVPAPPRERPGRCARRGEVAAPTGYAVLDLETTGIPQWSARIVSVAVVELDADGRELARHHSLVNPGQHIPFEAASVHGITDATVERAPTFGRLMPKVMAAIGDKVLVAHNLDFDLSVLQRELRDVARDYVPRRSVCTWKLARFLDYSLESYKLADCCAHWAIDFEETHDATNDALACAALLRYALDEGWAPETLVYDDLQFKRLQSIGDTRPASEGQLRRVWGLAKDVPSLRSGEHNRVDEDRLLDVVEAVAQTRLWERVTREQVQQVYDQLERAAAHERQAAEQAQEQAKEQAQAERLPAEQRPVERPQAPQVEPSVEPSVEQRPTEPQPVEQAPDGPAPAAPAEASGPEL